MAWKTPKVTDGWLYEPSSATAVAVGSPAWYSWLADTAHCCFHFEHPAGGLTVRKERKQRGYYYWTAYRQVHSKLYKMYVGKVETLTQERLGEVAERLADIAASEKQEHRTNTGSRDDL